MHNYEIIVKTQSHPSLLIVTVHTRKFLTIFIKMHADFQKMFTR